MLDYERVPALGSIPKVSSSHSFLSILNQILSLLNHKAMSDPVSILLYVKASMWGWVGWVSTKQAPNSDFICSPTWTSRFIVWMLTVVSLLYHGFVWQWGSPKNDILSSYGGFLSHRGTPHHPFVDGFSLIHRPAIGGTPMTMETHSTTH